MVWIFRRSVVDGITSPFCTFAPCPVVEIFSVAPACLVFAGKQISHGWVDDLIADLASAANNQSSALIGLNERVAHHLEHVDDQEGFYDSALAAL